jgi:hypothetical protein
MISPKNPVWLHRAAPVKSRRVLDAMPCVVIIAEKGNGMVDAFLMFWACGIVNGENLGKTHHSPMTDFAKNNEKNGRQSCSGLGTHIRFVDGVPKIVWLSQPQHDSGQAFNYKLLSSNRFNFSGP